MCPMTTTIMAETCSICAGSLKWTERTESQDPEVPGEPSTWVGCSKFESKIRHKKWCYFGAAKLLIFNTLIYEIVL